MLASLTTVCAPEGQSHGFCFGTIMAKHILLKAEIRGYKGIDQNPSPATGPRDLGQGTWLL